MPQIEGRVTSIIHREEEGGQDWYLTMARVLWIPFLILLAVAFFFLIHQTIGLVQAILFTVGLLFLCGFFKSIDWVFFDEVVCRLFPDLRSAVKLGVVPVLDLRLQCPGGQEVDCLIRGDLVGAEPKIDDELRLQGEFEHGTFIVQDGTILDTNARLAPRMRESVVVFIGMAAVFAVLLIYVSISVHFLRTHLTHLQGMALGG